MLDGGLKKISRMYNKPRNKRGQMKISFGMMFSIILIAIFAAVAIYVVIKIMGTAKCAQVGKFIDNFQGDVNQIWNSAGDAQKTPPASEYDVPGNVNMICFYDGSSMTKGEHSEKFPDIEYHYDIDKNMLFYPPKSGKCFSEQKIKHINISKITRNDNPYCVNVSDGEFGISISKDNRDTLVCLGEDC